MKSLRREFFKNYLLFLFMAGLGRSEDNFSDAGLELRLSGLRGVNAHISRALSLGLSEHLLSSEPPLGTIGEG